MPRAKKVRSAIANSKHVADKDQKNTRYFCSVWTMLARQRCWSRSKQRTASHGHPNLKTVPTVGQNVSTIDLPEMYLKIWDVGGQHSLRGLWQHYYASCHAIVFVVDSSDVGDANIEKISREGAGDENARLEECRLVLEDVLENTDTEGVPLLVLANKQDREDCVEVLRIKEGFVRKVFETKNGLRDTRVLPCSALSGTGVEEAVEWLCSRVKWNKESRPPLMR